MNLEPQKFFIGVIDFFSILLPGALLAYMLRNEIGPKLLEADYELLKGADKGAEAWVVFLFSSYLFGHFIFLLGSWVLDDHVYDPIRKATYAQQIKRLANGDKLSSRLTRWLAVRLIKKSADAAFNQAERIKNWHLEPLEASSAINAFQWCKARLALEHSDALAIVHRFEADSKFFRSLLVVLCVLVPWGALTGRWAIAVAGAVLLVLALWRYVDQRDKATRQAYWYVITLEGGKAGAPRQPSGAQADAWTHAGGVVFRKSGAAVEYLLVQATNAPSEWVLPQGHIESGEAAQETAVREVLEETGMWARVRDALKSVSFVAKGQPVQAQYYLMEAVVEARPRDRGRKHDWLLLEKALERATHPGSKELLKLAEQARAAL